MLVWTGIGKLIIFDNDKVEFANLNRMFYNISHVSLSKVEACQRSLQEINPLV